jgi:predicted permease
LNFFNAGGSNSLDVSMDRTVLWFTFGVSAATALIVGAYPAWFASKTDGGATLKARSQVTRGGVRRILIAVQISLSLVLMWSATIFTRSLANLQSVNLGYDIDHVAALSLVPRRVQSTPQSGPPMVQLSSDFQEFLSRAKQIPGVGSAALSFPGVLQGFGMKGSIDTQDEAGQGLRHVNCSFIIVSPHYFSTLRIPILRGRDFKDSDRTGSPVVAILNRRTAELLWPTGNEAVGRHLDLHVAKGAAVIGVVGNSKYQNIRESTEPIVYLSAYQMPVMAVTVLLRIPGRMSQTENEARTLLSTTAPSFQISNVTTMEFARDSLLAEDRLLALLSSIFGVLGTVMAFIGIFGLIACSVANRTREIGIRMSLGGQRSSVLNLFVGEAVKLLTVGIIIGLTSALLLGRFVASLLFNVQPTDPKLAAIAVGLTLFGGVVAALVPAIRAIRINPADALRHE